jgi:hypothetical protein
MITTKSAVFLHMQKTAGMTVKSILHPITHAYAEHHIPDSRPPQPHVFMFVRNPWDWYVSYYEYTMNGSETHTPPADSSSVIRSLRDQTFDEFIRCTNIPSASFMRRVNMFDKIERSQDRAFGCELGHRTWDSGSYFQNMCNQYSVYVTEVGTVERIRPWLVNMLRTSGELTPQMEQRIFDTGPVNVTQDRLDYHAYYTGELVDIVSRSNQQIINEHGYTFD